MKSTRSRKTIHGLNLLIMVVSMILVLGTINWLGNKHYKRWDLADPANEALSDQTINVLKNLNKDVTLTYFYTFSPYEESEQSQEEWKELLERYGSISKHFKYEMIDYAKNPRRIDHFFEDTKKITLEKNGSVIKCGEYVEKISETSESALTSAIIKVTRGQMRTICFTEGHGEHDPDESGAGGYYRVREALERENFNVKQINLVREGVPEACNIIVAAGPMLPFRPEEAALLEKWLDDAGKMLVMLDSTGRTGFESLLESYMILPEDDVLKTEESAAVGVDPFLIMADVYNPSHAITMPLSQVGVIVGDQVRAIPSYFYEARSLKIKEDPLDKTKAEELVTTTDNVRVLSSKDSPLTSRYQSFRSQAGAGEAAVGARAPIGEVGPQVVAAYGLRVVEYEALKSTAEGVLDRIPKRSARLVVFGDSDFAADGFVEQVPNGDIFLNTIAWLAEEEGSIGIRPKKKKFLPIHFAGSRNWFILAGILILVPLVVLVNGILVWREKKRL